MNYKEIVRCLCIIYVNVVGGRNFAYYPSHITVNPPKIIRRILFVIDIRSREISILGVIWQIMLYLTFFGIGGVAVFTDRTNILELFYKITLMEWAFVALPFGLYAGIYQLLKNQ